MAKQVVKLTKQKINTDKDLKNWVKYEFSRKYKSGFNKAFKQYLNIKPFKVNENIYVTNPKIKYNEKVQYIVKLLATYAFTEAFRYMKIDLDDPNVQRDKDDGNIGTPGRVAKMYVGSGLKDESELLSGRWTKKPRIATFPNENRSKMPITKRIDLVAVCSHHLAPFSSMFREDAYAIISYIPGKEVMGISKLQRLTNWIGRRGWLQEDLTEAIYNEMVEITGTKSVYVELHNIVHNCEFLRGAQSNDGAFSTVKYGGKFKKLKYRKMIKV